MRGIRDDCSVAGERVLNFSNSGFWIKIRHIKRKQRPERGVQEYEQQTVAKTKRSSSEINLKTF